MIIDVQSKEMPAKGKSLKNIEEAEHIVQLL